MKKYYLLIYLIFLSIITFTQTNDSVIIDKIFAISLCREDAYKNLQNLTSTSPKRLAGTAASNSAIDWAIKTMKDAGFDTVYLQKTIVKNWKRNGRESARVNSKKLGERDLNISSFGLSVGTGGKALTTSVVEVHNFDELKTLGEKEIKGKIVFFNRPADPHFFNTGRSYGSAIDQRTAGASEAVKYGAIAVIVRSVTLATDQYPHTGVMRYNENLPKIPAIAVATEHANLLSLWLKQDPSLELTIKTNCQMLEDTVSYNVIGEIWGTEYPKSYITIAGHLDCWDNCDGAHDDGAGCVESIEALSLFKALEMRPKHTLRAVMYMDEEIAQRGGRTYLENAKNNNETHITAIESDAGGFAPTGFSFSASEEVVSYFRQFKPQLEHYGLYYFEKGGSGVDISFLSELKIPLAGLVTNSQRYFDYHHSASDTIDKVNKRELQLGASTMAVYAYLFDIKFK